MNGNKRKSGSGGARTTSGRKSAEKLQVEKRKQFGLSIPPSVMKAFRALYSRGASRRIEVLMNDDLEKRKAEQDRGTAELVNTERRYTFLLSVPPSAMSRFRQQYGQGACRRIETLMMQDIKESNPNAFSLLVPKATPNFESRLQYMITVIPSVMLAFRKQYGRNASRRIEQFMQKDLKKINNH